MKLFSVRVRLRIFRDMMHFLFPQNVHFGLCWAGWLWCFVVLYGVCGVCVCGVYGACGVFAVCGLCGVCVAVFAVCDVCTICAVCYLSK